MSREAFKTLRARAEDMLAAGRAEGKTFALVTDCTTDPSRVGLGIARPGASCCIVLDKAEYNAIGIARILGYFADAPAAPTGHARAVAAKAKAQAALKRPKQLAGVAA